MCSNSRLPFQEKLSKCVYMYDRGELARRKSGNNFDIQRIGSNSHVTLIFEILLSSDRTNDNYFADIR